ncbi:MAG: LLM class flavin-dependent oxidoreductase, partial [Gammaproteobacteria bacterium]|nr:LLM class flavin-dependent oxidoreductase [Gammaproteobacteria bacterium]NIT63707.1 LLM class flavin-dependent oxidoreductase [Gammaproteobacteria bacterium]NIV20671.1 LLM class flavin-dependent oxidoreductase [Gammaproteobacteria bacterium]NIY32287.1 LLM class flavin-dependent oxidoreductase [Gammaproteobacteria bacterium]
LAEQIAMLSLLSQGDLYLGLGRGTARYEFERFEMDMAHTRGMFAEAVEIIHKGLAGKPFSHRGAHYNFPETLLRPIARPERVHLFGAVGSPESAGVMGELGLPLIHTS